MNKRILKYALKIVYWVVCLGVKAQ